jgi:hypothetical protein
MKYHSLLYLVIALLLTSCHEKDRSIIALEKVYAWCIVPFDSVDRGPEERIEMLKELGITQYAYDWRKEDLPDMAKELRLAKENEIEVIAVWIWIDDQWDSLEHLNDSNEKVFTTIEEVGYKGQIWLSFNANFFENLSDSAAVKKGANMIDLLSERASKLNCKIALYNHGDWFGEPENQIKIINTLPDHELGLVFNFHHAHKQIDRFPEMVEIMLPHLWSVNLNGLRKEGPKILAFGEGDHEIEMVNLLLKQGYKGDFGILGHVEDADVNTILEANLKGLKLNN